MYCSNDCKLTSFRCFSYTVSMRLYIIQHASRVDSFLKGYSNQMIKASFLLLVFNMPQFELCLFLCCWFHVPFLCYSYACDSAIFSPAPRSPLSLSILLSFCIFSDNSLYLAIPFRSPIVLNLQKSLMSHVRNITKPNKAHLAQLMSAKYFEFSSLLLICLFRDGHSKKKRTNRNKKNMLLNIRHDLNQFRHIKNYVVSILRIL